ncbi:MAG: hypothetical protein II777_06665 [Clostridia bacterium]|nr:hypothetical protein [Clostridia bacterium]
MVKKTVSLLCLFALFLLLIPGKAGAAEQTVTKLTAAISRNGGYIELKCTLSESDLQRLEGRKLTLTSASPYTDAPPIADVIAENVTPAAELTFQAPYTGDVMRVYSLAADNGNGTQSVIANRAYVENPDALSSDGAAFFTPATKKGLNFTMFADAQYLGVGNTVVTVALNEIITDDTAGLQCKSGSKYCYINREKLDSLDRMIKTCTDAGIRVFLQPVLTGYRAGQPEYLYCKNDGTKADFFAFNSKDQKAADSLFALVSFLMNRYAVNTDNGFCASLILGCEVNDNRNKNYAGPMSLYDYTERYALMLRTVDAAARSVYKDARVYVSLGNAFNRTALGENADPALDYSVTDFLHRLASCISEEGDFPWRVEIHPHNIDDDPIFTGKDGSEYAYEADYVTMDNFNIITSLLSRPAFLYNGQRRTVVINDISFKSDPNTAEAQKNQAAAFCLAYFRAEANDQVEAFIYGDHTDSASRGCAGLYTKKNGTDGTPEERKEIYKVFRYIDTDSSRIISEPFLTVFSASSWGSIVSGYNGASQMKTRILSGTGSPSDERPDHIRPVTVTDFSSGTGGFYPSENAAVISTDKDEEGKKLYGGEYSLYAELSDVDPHEYRGVSAVIKDGFELGGLEYALADISVKAPENVKATDIMLRFTGEAEDGVKTVYEGSAQVSSDAYHRIYFDISGFSSQVKKIDRVSVWVRPHGEKDGGEYSLTLHGVSVFRKSARATGGEVLVPALIIAGAVVLLLLTAYAVIFIRTRKQYKRPSAVKETETDR